MSSRKTPWPLPSWCALVALLVRKVDSGGVRASSTCLRFQLQQGALCCVVSGILLRFGSRSALNLVRASLKELLVVAVRCLCTVRLLVMHISRSGTWTCTGTLIGTTFTKRAFAVGFASTAKRKV